MQATKTTRRRFFSQLGAAVGFAALPAAMRAAISGTDPMKITRVDAVTFRKDLQIGGGSGSRNEGPEWV